HPLVQVWMRIVSKGARHQAADSVNLPVRNRFRTLSSTDDLDNAGNHQDRQPLRPGESGETVAQEQRDLDFLLPVLPLAEPHYGRQYLLDTLLSEPVAHLFLVTRACSDGIP